MNINRMDIGRLMILPIFTFLMTVQILIVYNDLRALLPVNMTKAIGLIHHLLIVCFYALIILLYFLRTSASSASKSFITNTIAVLTTFAPPALSVLSGPALIHVEMILVANFMIISGMVLSIYSLISLGKNFSIIPQARKLVQSGPYKLVRHPLYLSELIGVFGIVLAGITIPKIIVFFLLVGCQVYRAFQEEKLLAHVVPEYKAYSLKTARFIPGIF